MYHTYCCRAENPQQQVPEARRSIMTSMKLRTYTEQYLGIWVLLHACYNTNTNINIGTGGTGGGSAVTYYIRIYTMKHGIFSVYFLQLFANST